MSKENTNNNLLEKNEKSKEIQKKENDIPTIELKEEEYFSESVNPLEVTNNKH